MVTCQTHQQETACGDSDFGHRKIGTITNCGVEVGLKKTPFKCFNDFCAGLVVIVNFSKFMILIQYGPEKLELKTTTVKNILERYWSLSNAINCVMLLGSEKVTKSKNEGNKELKKINLTIEMETGDSKGTNIVPVLNINVIIILTLFSY
jgi:hypothetical protein